MILVCLTTDEKPSWRSKRERFVLGCNNWSRKRDGGCHKQNPTIFHFISPELSGWAAAAAQDLHSRAFRRDGSGLVRIQDGLCPGYSHCRSIPVSPHLV